MHLLYRNWKYNKVSGMLKYWAPHYPEPGAESLVLCLHGGAMDRAFG